MSDEGMPGAGFFEMARALGVEGAENLPAVEWVTIPMPPEENEFPDPFTIGTRVTAGMGPSAGRGNGTVVAWGRAKDADDHWKEEHEPVLRCTYGTECDRLVDNEGPVVRWDYQDPGDETLYWYGGQHAAILDIAETATNPQ